MWRLQVDAFQLHRNAILPIHRYENGHDRQFTLSSTRNGKENGKPATDIYSTLSSIDGEPIVFYQNKTDVEEDDDDDEGTAVMSSVTHWSDIMRQDSWLQQQQKYKSVENTSISKIDATTTTTTDALMPSNAKRLDDVSALSPEDLEQIEVYWDRLMPTVSYLGTAQVAKIYKALQVAYQAHRGQMRKSGEPFIIHVSRPRVFLWTPVVVTSCGGSLNDFHSKNSRSLWKLLYFYQVLRWMLKLSWRVCYTIPWKIQN